MMFIEIVIISVLIAFLRGGKFNNITYVRIKGIGFMIFGQVIYSISIRYIANTNNEISRLLFSNFTIIIIISFGLILYGLYKNKNISGVKISMLGIVLNLIPIIANDGRMPVSQNALVKLNMIDQLKILQEDIVITHTLITNSTKFKFLSDIIPVKYFLPKVISIGDIVLTIGIFLMIQKFMTSKDVLQ